MKYGYGGGDARGGEHANEDADQREQRDLSLMPNEGSYRLVRASGIPGAPMKPLRRRRRRRMIRRLMMTTMMMMG